MTRRRPRTRRRRTIPHPFLFHLRLLQMLRRGRTRPPETPNP